MSRLWNLAEDAKALVRMEADEIMADYPERDPFALARELDRSQSSYEGGPEMARAVAAELRRRGMAAVDGQLAGNEH